MAWEDLVRGKIIEPLDMRRTVVTHQEYLAAKNRSAANETVDGRTVATDALPRDAQAPAGGVFSTVNDMLRLLAFEIDAGRSDGRQIVAEAAMRETQPAQTIIHPAFPTLHYALGLEVLNDPGNRKSAV